MSAKQRKKAAASNDNSHSNGTARANGSKKATSSSRRAAADTDESADPLHATSTSLTAPAASSAPSSASPSSAPATRPASVSSFISKLYSIVSNPATQHIICWADHGQSFLVKDEYAFSLHIMRQHFRHSNFSSFVRQLNFYGFHKRSTPSAITQFDHPEFKRGREDLLHLIVRKSAGHGAEGEGKSTASSKEGSSGGGGGGDTYKADIRQLGQQVRQLKTQYEELAKMQQRILYVFSRYVNAEQGGGRRKRYVNAAADDDEGGGSGGGTAKKARLLIEDIETRTRRSEAIGATNGAHGSARSATRGPRRGSLMSPLAEINWSEQHAMQDLIHSPYMRGAPAVLNNTPLPIELPPLQSSMQTSPHDRRSRSPHPLLLTRGDEREEERKLSMLPRIDVPPRASARKATGRFYNPGDSPSSQSSTSTESESDRRARSLSLSPHFAHQPSEAAMQAWNNTAHVGGNGVIYAPPALHMADMDAAASLPLSPTITPSHAAPIGHEQDGGDNGWLNGGGVKSESDEFDLPSAAYPFSMPSSPMLDAISAAPDTFSRSHLLVGAPVVFPPSPLPLTLPPSPVPALAVPAVVSPMDGVDGLNPLLSSSSAPSTPRFPLSPFLTPVPHTFKPDPASR